MYENLLYESESNSLDFKAEQYEFEKASDEKKSELLKDILAFSNAWLRTTAYILIGVRDNKSAKAEIIGLQKDIDDAQLQQFINGKTNIPVDFNYKTIQLEGKKIGVIEITHTKRPVYIKKDYGRLKANIVYYRRGSSTAVATPEEIFNMGKDDTNKNQDIPLLEIDFCNYKSRDVIGESLNIHSSLINLEHRKNIPDFRSESPKPKSIFDTHIEIKMFHDNTEYYRELFDYYWIHKRINYINLSISNKSQFLATGIKVSITLRKEDGFGIFPTSKLPELPEKQHRTYPLPLTRKPINPASFLHQKKISIENNEDDWLIDLTIDKIYPNSTHYIEDQIVIFSSINFDKILNIKIFGDNIPFPIEQTLSLKCETKEIDSSLKSIIALHEEDSR